MARIKMVYAKGKAGPSGPNFQLGLLNVLEFGHAIWQAIQYGDVEWILHGFKTRTFSPSSVGVVNQRCISLLAVSDPLIYTAMSSNDLSKFSMLLTAFNRVLVTFCYLSGETGKTGQSR